MVKIIPAILKPNLKEFREDLEKVWGKVKRVQVDVIDGVFADNKTVMPEEVADIDTIVEWDWQLMVDRPERWVDRCLRGGPGRIFGHVEMMKDIAGFIADVQVAGMHAGLALDLPTDVAMLEEWIWDLDAVLLMSVKAGAQGQEFSEEVLPKIEAVRAMRKDIPIVVDGGIDERDIKKCFAAEWAEEIREGEEEQDFLNMEFAVGTHLLKSDNIEEEINNLENLKVHGGR